MNALETANAPGTVCPELPGDVLARAALAACHAQSRVARETLGRAGPLCRVPCAGCLAAARAVAEVVIEATVHATELLPSDTVTRGGA